MKKQTADYINSVINAQRKNTLVLKRPSGKQTAAYREQKAYYLGMIAMLDMIASEAYTESKSINDFLAEQGGEVVA